MNAGGSRRVRLRGTVEVQLPPAEAFELFTPSGERRWAHGWDPRFPSPPEDETEPGTVFETDSHGPLTWVVTTREPQRSISYAVVAPGIRAGTVAVECAPHGATATNATVTYDMTALSEAGERWLTDFAAGYDSYMEHWAHAIESAVKA